MAASVRPQGEIRDGRFSVGLLAGQVAIVTGASRGIGEGIARAFAREGASLVLAARDAELLEATADELRAGGGDVMAVATDVGDESQVKALFEKTSARYGRLDLLVNNAGISRPAALVELEAADWDATIATNLRGPFLCTREAMRIMVPQGRGRIINVASISSQRVRPTSAAYSASKFGLWGLTQVTALEGRPYGVSCSCLNPGNVMVQGRLDHPSPENQEPMLAVDELAQVAVTMAALPPHANLLEATVLPVGQPFIGRG